LQRIELGAAKGLGGNGTLDGGKQIGGLQLLVADVQTAGVVGGIDRGLWPFWRCYVGSFAAAGLTPGTATIQTMMNRERVSRKDIGYINILIKYKVVISPRFIQISYQSEGYGP
jgi:hypothetical protein